MAIICPCGSSSEEGSAPGTLQKMTLGDAHALRIGVSLANHLGRGPRRRPATDLRAVGAGRVLRT